MITRTKQFFGGLSRAVDGFSLVELVIVIIIVGLSSAIAVPIVVSNDTKAKITEADATLGSLRTQLRIYCSKNGEYPVETSPVMVVGANWNEFGSGALDQKYFTDNSYTYESVNGTDFILTCVGGSVLDSDRTLNHSGHLSGGN